MRNPVRKFVGVMVMGVLGALFALPMLSAGAQTTTTVVASDCSFSVTGTYPNFTVSGVAPAQSNVTLYFTPVGGQKTAQATQPGPSFSFQFVAPSEGDISVGYVTTDGNAYTAACATAAGEVVVRVRPASTPVTPGASTAANNAALAFTGSSDTPSYVLIGIAAVVVGAVLVVAARRRKQVS